MARFLVDEQLPPDLARRLRAIGHDAVHVYDIGMGNAPDLSISDEAAKRSAILISKDEDFLIMARLGGLLCKLLWIRVGNTTNKTLWQAVGPVLPAAVEAFDQGESIIEVR